MESAAVPAATSRLHGLIEAVKTSLEVAERLLGSAESTSSIMPFPSHVKGLTIDGGMSKDQLHSLLQNGDMMYLDLPTRSCKHFIKFQAALHGAGFVMDGSLCLVSDYNSQVVLQMLMGAFRKTSFNPWQLRLLT